MEKRDRVRETNRSDKLYEENMCVSIYKYWLIAGDHYKTNIHFHLQSSSDIQIIQRWTENSGRKREDRGEQNKVLSFHSSLVLLTVIPYYFMSVRFSSPHFILYLLSFFIYFFFSSRFFVSLFICFCFFSIILIFFWRKKRKKKKNRNQKEKKVK